MDWPEIPVKSAAVGLKASLMPIAGSTNLRLNLFCILNLETPEEDPCLWTEPHEESASPEPVSNPEALFSTLGGRCPSWFCAGRCPRTLGGAVWAEPPGRTVASSSRWVEAPAGSGSGRGTAAPEPCSADPIPSWTDLRGDQRGQDFFWFSHQ